MGTQNIGVLYTDSLPATVWREIAKHTTNLEFRAQIREELSKHSENDTLRIRIDHIIELPPPAPGEVTIRLSQETAQRLIHILEPVQDAALRDATYDMDAWLACQDVMTQIDGQTPLTFSAAPGAQ